MTVVLPNVTVEVFFNLVWTDISAYVRSGTITRGTNRFDGVLVQYEAGTAQVVLTNTDARFDTTNLSGPYSNGSYSFIQPDVPWRIRTTTDGGHTLWTGYADRWQCDYDPGSQDATCTLSGTDATKPLQTFGVVLVEPSTVASGTIITDVANSFGLTLTADAGNSTLQGGSINETNAWSFMQLVADSEIGEIYMRGDGNLVFRQRNAIYTNSRSNTPNATFGDAGVELKYTGFQLVNDDTQIKNSFTVQNVGGTAQTLSDTNSITAFNERQFSRTDLLGSSDADALSYAHYALSILSGVQTVNGVLSIIGDPRVEQITVNPAVDPTNLNPQVLGRELGDLITVKLRPPGRTSNPIVRNLLIRGIQHSFTPTSWVTTWSFQDTTRLNFLVFDNTRLGTFDSNKFGW